MKGRNRKKKTANSSLAFKKKKKKKKKEEENRRRKKTESKQNETNTLHEEPMRCISPSRNPVICLLPQILKC